MLDARRRTEHGNDEREHCGVLRLTLPQDQPSHVLTRCETDEPSGTWTGPACPDHGLGFGADVDSAILQQIAAQGEIADLIWEAPDEFTASHDQIFRSAIQTYRAVDAELAAQL
jgi:hypothetical protein